MYGYPAHFDLQDAKLQVRGLKGQCHKTSMVFQIIRCCFRPRQRKQVGFLYFLCPSKSCVFYVITIENRLADWPHFAPPRMTIGIRPEVTLSKLYFQSFLVTLSIYFIQKVALTFFLVHSMVCYRVT